MKKLTLKRVASVSCLIFSVAMRRRLLDIFTLWLRHFGDGPAISHHEKRSLSHSWWWPRAHMW